jgi:hypothetical protein
MRDVYVAVTTAFFATDRPLVAFSTKKEVESDVAASIPHADDELESHDGAHSSDVVMGSLRHTALGRVRCDIPAKISLAASSCHVQAKNFE